MTHFLLAKNNRGSDYSKGATIGAPQAIQVADRWHLLKNLRETLERFFDRNHNCLRAAALLESPPGQDALAESQTKPAEADHPPARLTKAQQDRQARRAKRLARYEAVHTLHKHSLTKNQIAKQLKMGRGTVSKFSKQTVVPFMPKAIACPVS